MTRTNVSASYYFIRPILVIEWLYGCSKDFFIEMENISYYVAAGKIIKELLHKILTGVLDGTYDYDEPLKLEIYNAISE